MEEKLVKKGDIIVRTKMTVLNVKNPCYLIGYIFKAILTSSIGNAYYFPGASIGIKNWRFATYEEILYFEMHTITNISEIKLVGGEAKINDIIVRTKLPIGGLGSNRIESYQIGYIFKVKKISKSFSLDVYYTKHALIQKGNWRHATQIEKTYFDHYNITNVFEINELSKLDSKCSTSVIIDVQSGNHKIIDNVNYVSKCIDPVVKHETSGSVSKNKLHILVVNKINISIIQKEIKPIKLELL